VRQKREVKGRGGRKRDEREEGSALQRQIPGSAPAVDLFITLQSACVAQSFIVGVIM